MSGYLHFSASQTVIANIAEEINNAGNAYHHTEYWSEKKYWGDKKSCSESIQDALNAADESHADLLAALKLVVDTYGFDSSTDSAIWKTANAAIAKAEGK